MEATGYGSNQYVIVVCDTHTGHCWRRTSSEGRWSDLGVPSEITAEKVGSNRRAVEDLDPVSSPTGKLQRSSDKTLINDLPKKP
jgi:hypothetical protein